MNVYQADSCDNCIKLKDLDNQYRTMISKITHEIRNPLTLIYSSVQFLEQEQPIVTDTTLLPQIKSDIQDTIRLLKDISMLNRTMVSQQTNLSISELLEGISASFFSLAREKSIDFLADLDESIQNQTLSGDEVKLREALLNLLLNAADALTDCPYSGKIILTAAVSDDRLVIHVRDNGPGIPHEYLATLFEPFVTHKTGGTGLGLSIAQNAAIQHGGALTVDTCCAATYNTSEIRRESYTDFCFSVPCAKNA